MTDKCPSRHIAVIDVPTADQKFQGILFVTAAHKRGLTNFRKDRAVAPHMLYSVSQVAAGKF